MIHGCFGDFKMLQRVLSISFRCLGVVAVTEVPFSPFWFRVNTPGSVHIRPSTLCFVGSSRAIDVLLHLRWTACQIKEQEPTEHGVRTTGICRSSRNSQFVCTQPSFLHENVDSMRSGTFHTLHVATVSATNMVLCECNQISWWVEAMLAGSARTGPHHRLSQVTLPITLLTIPSYASDLPSGFMFLWPEVYSSILIPSLRFYLW